MIKPGVLFTQVLIGKGVQEQQRIRLQLLIFQQGSKGAGGLKPGQTLDVCKAALLPGSLVDLLGIFQRGQVDPHQRLISANDAGVRIDDRLEMIRYERVFHQH